jgi:hypothetical protein
LNRPVDKIPKVKEYYGSGIWIIGDDEGETITQEGSRILFHPDVDLERNATSQYAFPEPGQPKQYGQEDYDEFRKKSLNEIEKARQLIEKEVAKLQAFLARIIEKGLLKSDYQPRQENAGGLR